MRILGLDHNYIQSNNKNKTDMNKQGSTINVRVDPFNRNGNINDSKNRKMGNYAKDKGNR